MLQSVWPLLPRANERVSDFHARLYSSIGFARGADHRIVAKAGRGVTRGPGHFRGRAKTRPRKPGCPCGARAAALGRYATGRRRGHSTGPPLAEPRKANRAKRCALRNPNAKRWRARLTPVFTGDLKSIRSFPFFQLDGCEGKGRSRNAVRSPGLAFLRHASPVCSLCQKAH
jgi:hypothetical protein